MWWNSIKLAFTKKEENNKAEDNLHLPLLFDEPDPEDVVFVKRFSACGGRFVYCEDNQEMENSLKAIISENKFPKLVCFDTELQKILKNIKIDYKPIMNGYPKDEIFLFMPCEYLIVYDGSIMVSSDQTKNFKLNELPYNIIVYSTQKQIATNLSCALRGIKRYKNENIPINITCIKGHKVASFEKTPNAKNIYLLMKEEDA